MPRDLATSVVTTSVFLWLASGACTGDIGSMGNSGQRPGTTGAPGGSGPSTPGGNPGPGTNPGPGGNPGPGANPGGPSNAPPPVQMCVQPSTASRPRLWRLDDGQYGKTVATLLKGRSADGNDDMVLPSGLKLPLAIVAAADVRFSTRSSARHVADSDAEDIARAGYDVSERLLADAAIAACVSGTGSLRVCLEQPLMQKAELAFRRPVVAADVAHYLAAAEAAVASPGGRREAARLALQALLIAPRFVFRTELGADAGGRVRLDAFEVADALSYSLTDGPPDQALWADAKSGAVLRPEVTTGHITRLLTAAEKKGPARNFVRELFAYRDVLKVTKVAKFHQPDTLLREADLFTENVLRKNAHAGFFKELLTSRNGFVSPATAQSYNATLTGTSTTAQPFTYTGERQGLLGHPAWLVGYAAPDPAEFETVILRGRFVSDRFLCAKVPNAPIGIIVEVAKDPTKTVRERLTIHKKDPTCSACHRVMDGLGLGFEGFDDLGRTRTTEAMRPVVRSGEMVGSGDQDGPFEGLEGLTTKLLASQTVASCLAAQTFEFFMGRTPNQGDACTVQDALRQYQTAGGDLTAMVRTFFVSDGFLYRTQ